jgi:hypothetical protein
MIRGNQCVILMSFILSNGIMVSRKFDRVICMGLKTSSLSMMKKAISLLVYGQNLGGYWLKLV